MPYEMKVPASIVSRSVHLLQMLQIQNYTSLIVLAMLDVWAHGCATQDLKHDCRTARDMCQRRALLICPLAQAAAGPPVCSGTRRTPSWRGCCQPSARSLADWVTCPGQRRKLGSTARGRAPCASGRCCNATPQVRAHDVQCDTAGTAIWLGPAIARSGSTAAPFLCRTLWCSSRPRPCSDGTACCSWARMKALLRHVRSSRACAKENPLQISCDTGLQAGATSKAGTAVEHF